MGVFLARDRTALFNFLMKWEDCSLEWIESLSDLKFDIFFLLAAHCFDKLRLGIRERAHQNFSALSHALCTWCGAASLLAHHLSAVAVEVPGDFDGVRDVIMKVSSCVLKTASIFNAIKWSRRCLGIAIGNQVQGVWAMAYRVCWLVYTIRALIDLVGKFLPRSRFTVSSKDTLKELLV